jgi:hypothetical protein
MELSDRIAIAVVGGLVGELVQAAGLAQDDLVDGAGATIREHDASDGLDDAIEVWVSTRGRGMVRVGIVPRSTVTALIQRAAVSLN